MYLGKPGSQTALIELTASKWEQKQFSSTLTLNGQI